MLQEFFLLGLEGAHRKNLDYVPPFVHTRLL